MVLATVVANALRAAASPVRKRVHYSRRIETYSAPSSLYPDHLRSPTFLRIVDTLGDIGFLSLVRGISEYHQLDGIEELPRQSTFEATAELCVWLRERGIATEDLDWDEAKPLVILKDADKRRIGCDQSSPEVAQMVAATRAYNAFAKPHEVSLPLDVLERAQRKPKSDGTERETINVTDKALYRVFNNGRLDQGGRFSGGWWMWVPKECRPHILIDGVKTVELDYSGCFIRMLYHLEGYDLDGDPYDVPEIRKAAEKQGMDWDGMVRGAIKELLNTYINAPLDGKIGKFPTVSQRLPKGFKLPNRVYPLFDEKHHLIKDSFHSGCGLELMRYESDICAQIMADGVRDGKLVLPIHDSFIVQEQHEEWLRGAMVRNYRDRLGFDPEIN